MAAMGHSIARREFLKTASAAAGALALAVREPIAETEAQTAAPASVEIGAAAYTPVADYPIRAKRHAEVTLRDAFWKPKVATNATVTIPFEVQKLTENGRALSGNVLEAAIYSLETHSDPALQTTVDSSVRALASRSGDRLSNEGFEVAAAWYRATGKRDLLEPAIKTADALYEDFRVRHPPFSGGERDAINCLQLYKITGEKKHLDLAKYYLDIRGLPNSVGRSRHNQSYKPVLEQSEAVGHAVNCCSLMVSVADVGVLTGLSDYFKVAERMWTDAATRKMYITGGVGSTGNEGFGEAYALPNISAYAETCAVLMFITFNHRMFLATGDSKYIDVMERGMYNNAIDGVSASGDRFFYVNRLASAGDGRDVRWQRASLECCPPNLVRFLASMPGLIYAQDKADAVFVNLYVSSEASFTMHGQPITLLVDSDLPWEGASTIAISTKPDAKGVIKLRVPGWTRNQPSPGSLYHYVTPSSQHATASVNGRPVGAAPDALGYVSIDRVWKNGDVIAMHFPMDVRRVAADARVRADRGRTAVERGPIVYCAEWPEVGGKRVLDLLVARDAPLDASTDPTRDGAEVIHTLARQLTNPSLAAAPVALIPYYQWANRGPGEMTVWLSHAEYAIGDTGPAGGLIFYDNPHYATDGWRYLEAAPVDQSAGAKWGCFRTPTTGARGTAIGTGRDNTKEMLANCVDPGTAARLCSEYTLNGVGGWFLPSRDELAQMYRALKATGLGDFAGGGVADNFSYWSSSQQTTDMAAHIDFADNGRQHSDDKDFPRRVRAIRMI
jgi:hypothetical protein